MRLISLAGSALFILALIFGGGTKLGEFSDVIPEVFSLIVMFLTVYHWHEKSSDFGLPLALIVAMAALVLIQVLPLPMRVWSWLPGRSELIRSFSTLGIDGIDSRLSLRPSETVQSAFALFPAVSLFLVAPFLSLHRRVKLVLILASFVFLSIIIGFMQILGGVQSGLYFFEATTIGRAVGFFANPNHFTGLLYASLPFVLAIFAERSHHIFSRSFVMMGVVTFIWLVGLSISGSRSALILGGLSLGLSFFFFARHVMPETLSKRNLLLSGLLLGLVLLPVLLGVGLTLILNRFEAQDLVDDARTKILPLGLKLLWSYLPFGSGFGTFSAVYSAAEPADAVMPAIVNHAHNDLLELAIEGGLPAFALMGIWVGYVVRQITRALPLHNDLEGRLQKAALIAIVVLTLHSFVDYPLRTIALMSLFALAHGFLLPARHHHDHAPHLLDDGVPHVSVWDVMPFRSRKRSRRSSSLTSFGVDGRSGERAS